MQLNLPSSLTVVLGAIAGVLVGLNEAVFSFAGPWQTGITIALTILAAWGISPLTGASFRAILHLTNAESNVVAAILAALQVIFIQASGISSVGHAVIAGILAFAASLGFAPAIGEVISPTKETAAESKVAVRRTPPRAR